MPHNMGRTTSVSRALSDFRKHAKEEGVKTTPLLTRRPEEIANTESFVLDLTNKAYEEMDEHLLIIKELHGGSVVPRREGR